MATFVVSLFQLPTPDSRFPIPDSLLPILYSRLPRGKLIKLNKTHRIPHR
ncbi:hypothetical protein [Moorena producens]|nr:hypothetical protein [Moorena producens]